jgi:putative ABC transport system permease protein
MKMAFAHYWAETFIQDVRYGMRQIWRGRLLAVAVILTLALGIGLNTGIFSVLNGMLFRPRVTKHPATFVHLTTEVLEKNQGIRT